VVKKDLKPRLLQLWLKTRARISHKCVINLFCGVSLQCRTALWCMEVLSSTGFSLCSADSPQLKPHRLKPAPLDRAGPALSLLVVNPAGIFHRVHLRNGD